MQPQQFDDQLVDDVVRKMGQLIYHYKSTVDGICAQLPVETAEGAFHQLSYAQYRVIVHLWKNGQSPVGEIAHRIGVTIATASELVDKLVDAGLLSRSTNPDDRRQVLIHLTERSERVAEQIHQIRRAQVRQALAVLSPADAESAARVLDAFATALTKPPADDS